MVILKGLSDVIASEIYFEMHWELSVKVIPSVQELAIVCCGVNRASVKVVDDVFSLSMALRLPI